MRKICVITGSRADYGLLYATLQGLKKSSEFELQLFVTGAHLYPEFGLTYKEIEADGFVITEKIDLILGDDSATGVCKSMGIGLAEFSKAFQRHKPDIAVILGDRYEALSAGLAASMTCIPIAHIHGGEITEGAIDDALRHCLSKLSHLHFTSTESYRKRVIQMGEPPHFVFNVGAPGIENIKGGVTLLEKNELEKKINFNFGRLSFLVTYHPATLGKKNPSDLFNELLSALDSFPEAQIIFTYPNADINGRGIIDQINDYVKKNKTRTVAIASMGQQKYLSALQYVDTVIGNSSSGIIEVPSFKKATVNIGDRQKGRILSSSVISCQDDANSITQAIKQSLDSKFVAQLSQVQSPYGDGQVSKKILEVLRKVDLSKLNTKSFYDLET